MEPKKPSPPTPNDAPTPSNSPESRDPGGFALAWFGVPFIVLVTLAALFGH